MRIALILAGGAGTRLGEKAPKQYLSCAGRMMITRCLETVYRHEALDAVQIAAAEAWRAAVLAEQARFIFGGDAALAKKFRGFSAPGETRQLSILNGLRGIVRWAGPEDVVMVHDAARPRVSARLISDCLSAMAGHDGVMPALPMKDTVYLSRDGRAVSGLLERRQVFAGQSPEFFRLGAYLLANESLSEAALRAVNGATEPAVLAGLDIVMTPGEEGNFKVTTRADFARYLALLEHAGGG